MPFYLLDYILDCLWVGDKNLLPSICKKVMVSWQPTGRLYGGLTVCLSWPHFYIELFRWDIARYAWRKSGMSEIFPWSLMMPPAKGKG